MFSSLSTEALARGSARRPWLVIELWVLTIGVAIALNAMFLSPNPPKDGLGDSP